jgi:hypothetical protein
MSSRALARLRCALLGACTTTPASLAGVGPSSAAAAAASAAAGGGAAASAAAASAAAASTSARRSYVRVPVVRNQVCVCNTAIWRAGDS